MPDFESNIDLDVDEFLIACTTREIKEVVEWLKDEGEISDEMENEVSEIFIDTPWGEALKKLLPRKHLLTVEEENLILKISSRLI